MRTPEQRQARILLLQSRIAELREWTDILEAELTLLQADEKPEEPAARAKRWYEELRVAGIIDLAEFELLLDDCRERKEKSMSNACVEFRNRLELPMSVAITYIKQL